MTSSRLARSVQAKAGGSPRRELLFCHGSKVSVGEWKLCHTVLLLESLITRLPVSRRVTVVCLPEDVLLSHTVVPLVSARTRLPSWPSDILEPYRFTGE
uniref:Uncharacterized protein n=1 Tax=Leersia perrieri TaxID=77586 RepID=A0A0D9V3Y4_9ORYZ